MIDKKRLITFATGRRLLLKGSAGRPELFLTFDDGPHEVHTPRLLDLLSEHSIQATFFVVGREVHLRQDLVREIHRRGHELGNHTLAHLRMDRLSDRARLLEIRGMDSMLTQYDGKSSHYFRPPYGGISTDLVRCCLTHGIRIALWSRDSMDYKGDSQRVISEFGRRPAVHGDVLLFHDDADTSLDALRQLLPRWLEAGFAFKTVSQMS